MYCRASEKHFPEKSQYIWREWAALEYLEIDHNDTAGKTNITENTDM